jgi:cytochrome c2
MTRLLACLVLVLFAACKPSRANEPQRGNAERGKELLIAHGCYDCHRIPGIDRAPGPGVPTSLEDFADRDRILNDSVENSRANLEAYLQKPKSVYPQARMPGIGDRPQEAMDMAAYLMTLD